MYAGARGRPRRDLRPAPRRASGATRPGRGARQRDCRAEYRRVREREPRPCGSALLAAEEGADRRALGAGRRARPRTQGCRTTRRADRRRDRTRLRRARRLRGDRGRGNGGQHTAAGAGSRPPRCRGRRPRRGRGRRADLSDPSRGRRNNRRRCGSGRRVRGPVARRTIALGDASGCGQRSRPRHAVVQSTGRHASGRHTRSTGHQSGTSNPAAASSPFHRVWTLGRLTPTASATVPCGRSSPTTSVAA